MEKDVRPFETVIRGPFVIRHTVNASGYQWDTTISPVPEQQMQEENKGGPWLVDGVLNVEKLSRQYSPFDEPNLHRRLARLIPTLQNIKHFADKYGLLGHGVVLCYLDRGSNPLQLGESFNFWQQEIEQLGALTNLWDCIQQERLGELYKYVSWNSHPRSVLIKLIHPSGKALTSHLIAHENHLPDKEIIARWKTNTVLEPASFFVHQQINGHLRKHVSPGILPFYDGEIMMFPDCLLSALYVLFALEVSGRMRPKVICRGCGTYFIPKHGSQKYCKPSCSKLKYYHKTKEKEPYHKA